MRTIAGLLLPAALALGAVDGTVINRTTKQPQAGAMVILFRLGAKGPEPLANATTDAQGKFTFPQSVEGGPHLVESSFDGVNYSVMLPPGRPASGLEVNVWNSSRQPGAAKVSQHMILLEPTGQQLNVSETILLNNPGDLTWQDASRGTVRFWAPPEMTKDSLRVMAEAPNGMPVQRNAEEAGAPGAYKVNFPIKPGETRIDVAYSLPFASPGVYSGKALMPETPLRLVTPRGVTLLGDGLRSLGNEPNTQAAIYEVSGAAYKVEIQGVGSLRSTAPAADEAAGEDEGSSLQSILPRVYDRLGWILVPLFLALALGFVLLFRSGAVAAALPKGKQRG
jgi:hypothetical protein